MSSETQRLLGIERTEVDIKEYGNTVRIKDSAYAATNHYIRQSRPFFPNRKLYEYVYFQRMRWLIALLFFINLFSFDSFYVAVGMDLLNFIFLFIFLQHQCVNCCTMRHVRSQPIDKESPKRNTFYKVSLRELSGVFLTNYRAGIGCVAVNEQEVKIQVFNGVADYLMRNARCYSIVYLFIVILMAVYSGYFTYYTLGQYSPEDQFPLIRKWCG